MIDWLEWIDGRYHVDGLPIHAGTVMEMRFPDYTWQCVRIESRKQGAELLAFWDYHGETVCCQVDQRLHRLRWMSPTRSQGGVN